MSLRISPDTAGAGNLAAPACGEGRLLHRRTRLLGAVSMLAALVAVTVMASSARAEECPNTAFRTGPSEHLPDCRAYELVTPAEKNAGAPFLVTYGPEGLSATVIITAGTAGLEGLPSAGIKGPEGYYTVSRTDSGWTTVGADPPIGEYTPLSFSEIPHDFAGESANGLTTVWLERGVEQPDNSLGIFERLPDRSIVDVGPALPPTAPVGNVKEVSRASELTVQGVSPDASHVVFSLKGDYWPSDDSQSGTESLYEYAGTGNPAPVLVGVDDAGTLISRCGTFLGAPAEGDRGNYGHNALSPNGKTVFFTARCGTSTEDEIYARVDGGEPDVHTVDISEPSKADCKSCDTEAGVLSKDAHFDGASEDGSKVFFSTSQPLLAGDGSTNIYEYDFDAPPGERVVRIAGSTAHAEVLSGMKVTVSEDGSHVYFLAHGVLTNAPNGEGETAEAGGDNLYVLERDASYPVGHIEFVARLSEEDLAALSDVADVTPNGRFLVFTSERDLTPDTTTTGVEQVFEYDAQTGMLARISKGQDGFNNDGNVPAIPAIPPKTFNNIDNANIVTSKSPTPGTSVSADGAYVFFESVVGLTPQALDRQVLRSYMEKNEQVSVFANNVYEYHDGQVSLIYSGASGQVKLLGTDESGQDVLFTTVDKLVGQDTDTTGDIYDARIDGGFPAPAPLSCSGEACQGALSGAPTLLSPSSELQAGGNPPLATSTATKVKAKVKPKSKRKRCKKGLTAKRGKCVRSSGRKAKKASEERRSRS